MKPEVRELNTKDLPDLVTNEVTQAVDDRKKAVKEVIDVFLRFPTLIVQMNFVMRENDEV